MTDPVPEVIVPVRPPDGVSDVALTAVVLRIVVDEHGSVVAISLVQGSPSAVPAVIEAIRKRKYKPGLIDGRPVRVSMVVEIAANEIVTQQSR